MWQHSLQFGVAEHALLVLRQPSHPDVLIAALHLYAAAAQNPDRQLPDYASSSSSSSSPPPAETASVKVNQTEEKLLTGMELLYACLDNSAVDIVIAASRALAALTDKNLRAINAFARAVHPPSPGGKMVLPQFLQMLGDGNESLVVQVLKTAANMSAVSSELCEVRPILFHSFSHPPNCFSSSLSSVLHFCSFSTGAVSTSTSQNSSNPITERS
jgi:hypothetical protein